MKNFEKYEKEIIELTNGKVCFGVLKTSGKPCKCNDMDCCNCLLGKLVGRLKLNCNNARILWLYEEYKEPIKLTRLEYELLKYFSKSFRYADKDEVVVFYNNDDDFLNLEEWGEDLFDFLFRGGELEIQDILNNCEVDENA